MVTGQLLGLDVGSVLEVTNCFPFPVSVLLQLIIFIARHDIIIIIMFSNDLCIMLQIREEDEEVEAEGANYQLEMMRCLREVNVDNNTVGW